MINMNNKIYNEIINRKNGVATSVIYETDMNNKMKAKYKNSNTQIKKITETVCRVGCCYDNMKSVIDRRANAEKSEQRAYTNPYKWIIQNKIKENVNNGQIYAVLGTVKNAKPKITYLITNSGKTKKIDNLDSVKELFTPSTFTKPKYEPDVITVKIENIVSFNNIK